MAPLNSFLVARQDGGQQQQCSGVDGGGIAGIVLGTFFGTLLLCWLINRSRANNAKEDYIAEHIVDHDREARRRRRRSSRRGSSSYGERETVSTSGTRTFVGDDGRTYKIREPSRVVYKS